MIKMFIVVWTHGVYQKMAGLMQGLYASIDRLYGQGQGTGARFGRIAAPVWCSIL